MAKFQETENNINLKTEANIQYKFVANCKRYSEKRQLLNKSSVPSIKKNLSPV